MANHRITVLPGDGTGREVTSEALNLLKVVEQHSPLSFSITEIPCGGNIILKQVKSGLSGSFEHCRDESDAILFGAIGWPGAVKPNGDLAGGQVILGLRSGLDLFANVRPIKLYNGIRHKIHGEFKQVWTPGLVDMSIIRENTEGCISHYFLALHIWLRGEEYSGISDISIPGMDGEFAWDPRPISRIGSERVIRFAFELALQRSGNPSDGTTE